MKVNPFSFDTPQIVSHNCFMFANPRFFGFGFYWPKAVSGIV